MVEGGTGGGCIDKYDLAPDVEPIPVGVACASSSSHEVPAVPPPWPVDTYGHAYDPTGSDISDPTPELGNMIRNGRAIANRRLFKNGCIGFKCLLNHGGCTLPNVPRMAPTVLEMKQWLAQGVSLPSTGMTNSERKRISDEHLNLLRKMRDSKR